MEEKDLAWITGQLESRGSISVSLSGNVIGTVTFNFNSEVLKDLACQVISNAGVQCNPATIVGRTRKVNFTSTRGTRLLRILQPYMKDPRMVKRAELFMEIFPEESAGKHAPMDRLEGFTRWSRLLNEELRDDAA